MEDWEKELRKKKKINALIINKPEFMHSMRRRVEISVTTIGWVVWLFLCRPALLLVLWLVGFRFFYRHMIDLSGLAGLEEMKIFYISVIIAIILLMRGWNMYNKMRFGKKDRRKFAPKVSEENLEDYFKLPQNSAQKLWNMGEITVDFLEDHQFHVIDTKNPNDQFYGFFKPT